MLVPYCVQSIETSFTLIFDRYLSNLSQLVKEEKKKKCFLRRLFLCFFSIWAVKN